MEVSAASQYRILISPNLETRFKQAIEKGILDAIESENQATMLFHVIYAKDFSGLTPAIGYELCAQYAANIALGNEHRNPEGVPQGLL